MTRTVTLPLPSFKTVFLTGLVCCAGLLVWWKGEALAAYFSRPVPTIHRVEALDVPPLYVGKPDELIEFVGEAGETVRGVNAVIYRDSTATFTEAEPPGDWGGVRWRRWHRVRESERSKEAAVLVPVAPMEAPSVREVPRQEGKHR